MPITVGWLVLCSNAFNLIDGIDGLATGVGVVAALTTLIAAMLNGNIPLALATGPLIGALCAFLYYNFNGFPDRAVVLLTNTTTNGTFAKAT